MAKLIFVFDLSLPQKLGGNWGVPPLLWEAGSSS